MSIARPGRLGRSMLALASAVLLAAASATSANGQANYLAKVDQQVLGEISANGGGSFFVYLTDQADVSAAGGITDRAQRRTHVYQQLTATAERSQKGLRTMLSQRGVGFDAYWIANAIRVTGDRTLLNAIAARGEVWRIEPDRTYRIVEPVSRVDTGPGVNAIEWGVNNIRAPQVWSDFGVRGEGVVVANIDTGAQYNHPALVNQYRGNKGGGTFDHNYNWYDPSNTCANPSTVPCDNNNHGSHTMGTMVGDDGTGNQIGVAPGAKWMAAKGCESGSCSSNSLLRSGEWVIAPRDLNGQNPRPELGADIVNNSWGGGQADTWYQQTIRNWIAAGTFPVFSQGNSGPNCGTANSPADNPEAYGVGAYDINNAIANFSSRGPSRLDQAIKPNIGAPGVNVRSSVRNNGYSNFSGTSMAAPHLSGAVALLWSASATTKGDIAATRNLLNTTAVDVNSTGCGGTAQNNNNFGEGRLDAWAAVNAAPRGPTGSLTGKVTDSANGAAVSGATVRAGNSSALTGADGVYALRLAEGTYDVTASHNAYNSSTATGVVVRVNQTTTQDFALTKKPTGTLAGTVTDSVTGAAVSGVAVTAGGTSATTDANGRYSMSLATGTYDVTASRAGYRAQTATGVVINANATTTQNFVLVPSTGTVTGRATRASNGTPVSGATVQVFRSGGPNYSTRTDANGNYRLAGVEEGTYTMYVYGGGCFLNSGTVTVVAGQTTVRNVSLNCFS